MARAAGGGGRVVGMECSNSCRSTRKGGTKQSELDCRGVSRISKARKFELSMLEGKSAEAREKVEQNNRS